MYICSNNAEILYGASIGVFVGYLTMLAKNNRDNEALSKCLLRMVTTSNYYDHF